MRLQAAAGGNIRILPDGRARLRIKIPGKGRTQLTFDSKTEAQQAREAVRLERQLRRAGLPSILTTRAPALATVIKDFRREHDKRSVDGTLGNRTVDNYYQCTAGVLQWLTEDGHERLLADELTDRHIARYVAWRKGRKLTKKARRPASEVQVRKDLVMVVRVYRWAGIERRWSIPKKLPRDKGGKPVQPIEKLIAWLDALPFGSAERTVAEVAIVTGFRPSDLYALELPQLDLHGRLFRFIVQKTGKPLVMPFDDDLAVHLEAWLKRRQPTLHHQRLFHLEGRALTSQTFRRRYRASSMAAGMFPPLEYIGVLRNSFVAHLLDAGTSLGSIQRALAHSDPRTTADYARGFLPMRALRDVAHQAALIRRGGGGIEPPPCC